MSFVNQTDRWNHMVIKKPIWANRWVKRGDRRMPNQKGVSSNRFVTAQVLQKIAKAMVPFYEAIASKPQYAKIWSNAIVKADLDQLQRLLCHSSPLACKQGLGTNAIGYFVSFTFPYPIEQYTNGTTIPPGMTQFVFETKVHRAIARNTLPLYRKLAFDRSFSSAFAKAIRMNESQIVQQMVRSLIPSPELKSIRIANSGISLLFKCKGSRYYYRNMLFHDVL